MVRGFEAGSSTFVCINHFGSWRLRGLEAFCLISCPGGLNAYRLVRGLEAYRLTLIYADASCYCNALLSSKN